MTNRVTRTSARLVGSTAAALTLAAVAFGAVEPARAAAKPASAAKTKSVAKIPSTLPSFKVIDLATAKAVDLGSFNVSSKPQLIWFWAPT